MKTINGLKFYTFEETFKKVLQSKKHRQAYEEELTRLRLVSQIRELRRSKKLTQKGFALKIGVPQSVIARLETGRHSFSLGTLYQIASAFGKKIVLA